MHVIIGATLVLSILVCLILTQSRTAYVGVCMQLVLLSCFFGRMLLTGVRHRVGTTRMSVAGLGVATIIASVIAVAWHRGKIDEMVFTQAAKSFTYRLQYWQATVQLIRERPWGGTGPGNFRSHYLRHKLPESSEEIVDPHNMVLELVATSGLLAGAALIGCIGAGLAMILLRRSVHRTSSGSEGAISLWVAGVAAFIVAAALSPMVPWTYVALFLVWSLAAAAMWWLVPLEIDSSVIAIALIGLAVHLLGAGGISMPGVSQTLWAVLAVGVNISEGSGKPYQIQDMKWTRAVLLAGFAAWASFLLLVLRPVTAGLSALSLGRALVAQRDLGGSEVQFRAAAAEDRLSVEPWLELSRIHYERWRTDRGRTAEEQFGQAVAALDQAHQLAPSQLEPVRRLAELYEMRAEQTGGFWAKAAEKYKRCVEMYPTNAGLHAHLARALWKSGQAETALETAARARQLDAQTPHPDHKLTDADRKILEPLQAPLAPVE